MRTRIKFCGLVRPEDVDTAVALGGGAVGFVFYPKSPRYVDALLACELRRRLPSWVCAVGLVVNEPIEAVLQLRVQAAFAPDDHYPADCPKNVRCLRGTRKLLHL